MTKTVPRRRWYQFTLRQMCVIITVGSVVLGLAPVAWETRFTAPRRLPILEPGTIQLGDTTVYLPIQKETAEAYYLWDGGTFGVIFFDARGNQHKVYSWQSMNLPDERLGEILLGGWSPEDGGINIGKDPNGERLIFSVMELIDWSEYIEGSILSWVYPNLREIATGIYHRYN
ncbi:MAG: hypothetical protein COA78_02850 [Blastopirellula sp.]|nr:MAG: hypothetical protein COA78_02850 [Blastopirellula sp.]